MVLVALKGSELWAPLLKVACNGLLLRIPNSGSILGDHGIYFGMCLAVLEAQSLLRRQRPGGMPDEDVECGRGL